jgi:hypothetical protein
VAPQLHAEAWSGATLDPLAGLADSNWIARSNSRRSHSLLEWACTKESKKSARWRAICCDGDEEESQTRDVLGTYLSEIETGPQTAGMLKKCVLASRSWIEDADDIVAATCSLSTRRSLPRKCLSWCFALCPHPGGDLPPTSRRPAHTSWARQCRFVAPWSNTQDLAAAQVEDDGCKALKLVGSR